MTAESRPTWGAALVIFYSAIGFVLGGTASTVFAALALADYINGEARSGFFGIWSAVTLAVIAAAGLPAMAMGIRTILRKGIVPTRILSKAWMLSIVAYPVGLALGYWIYEMHAGPPLYGTLAQVLALGGPILAMAVVLQLAGNPISAMRAWGHFLLGLWFIPALAFVIELALLVVGILVLVGGMLLSPSGRQLLDQLQAPPGQLFIQPPPDVTIQMLTQPWVAALAVLFVAVLIPAVEEGLKSIAVWPILPRSPSPSQAFIGGALGGLGFALVEGLFLTQPDSTWFTTALIRAGASMMHAFGAGLTAWGLAEAVVRHRIWRFPLAYVTAISLHGFWNLGAIGLGVGQFGPEFGLSFLSPEIEKVVVILAASALSLLTLLALGGLPLIARRLAGQTGPGSGPGPTTAQPAAD